MQSTGVFNGVYGPSDICIWRVLGLRFVGSGVGTLGLFGGIYGVSGYIEEFEGVNM